MRSVYSHHLGRQIVSTAALPQGIEGLLSKTPLLHQYKLNRKQIPVYVGIEVSYNNHPAILRVLKSFLRELRALHQRFFIRFVTDMVWAEESECGDIFYTLDDIKDDQVDITWNITVTGDTELDVMVSAQVNESRHTLLHDLSRNLKPVLAHQLRDYNERELKVFTANFFHASKYVSRILDSDVPFHIMLVANRAGDGVYPIPIYGMSNSCARFKNRICNKSFVDTERKHPELFAYDITSEALLVSTFGMLLDNLEITEPKQINYKERYALAEQLFYIYRTLDPGAKSDHDLMVFIDKPNRIVETAIYPCRSVTYEK